MTQEAYVSFEVARLLKEKGFEQNNPDVEMYYRLSGDMSAVTGDEMYNIDSMYAAPTHQMAIRWLREKYKIYISIQPDFPSDKDYEMCWCWSVSTLHEKCISIKGYQCYIKTYEKAVDAALKYTLENLVKEEKQ